jgi:hypothetical protein
MNDGHKVQIHDICSNTVLNYQSQKLKLIELSDFNYSTKVLTLPLDVDLISPSKSETQYIKYFN